LFFSALSAISAVNKKRADLTAEIAEDAEGKKYYVFVVPGVASQLLAFLSALSGLGGEFTKNDIK
jgi:hypothetical protein